MASSERHKEQSRINANIYSQALRELRDRHPEEFNQIWKGLGGGVGKNAKSNPSPLRSLSGQTYCPQCKTHRPSRGFCLVMNGKSRICFWCQDPEIDAQLEGFSEWLKAPKMS